MTYAGSEFLDQSWQQSTKNVGGVLRALAKRYWPKNTAKQVATVWEMDLTTATNLTKGHASERTITKALIAGDWPLLMELGEALYGKTYAEHLLTLAQEAADAQRKAADNAAWVARLERIARGTGGLAAGEADLLPGAMAREPRGQRNGLGNP